MLLAVRCSSPNDARNTIHSASAAQGTEASRPVGSGPSSGLGWPCANKAPSPLMPLIAAWPITMGLSGGFTHQHPTHGQLAFAVELSRWTIPYLMLISLVSLLGGILNSLNRFWVNAAAPILLNISMVAALWFFHGKGAEATLETARVQAISVTVGGAL